MRLALLVTLLALPALAQSRFDRFCSRSEQGRSDRGFDCGNSYAFFEFAPPSGAGMPAACSGGTATGAKGETVTVTRAGGTASCLKGSQYTGIAPGDMVQGLAANTARTSTGGGSTLLIYAEGGATNLGVQSEDFSNAAYTSTASVIVNSAVAPDNALTADTLNDVSAVAIQSSCQTIITSSATPFAASVFLRSGSISKASIRLTGTGSSTGDCVTSTTSLATTYTRLECDSPAAYAGTLTSVTVCVEVGTVVGDTGTVIAWGLQAETTPIVGAGATSYVATAAAAASRGSEMVTATLPSAMPVATGSIAVTSLLFGTQRGNSGLVGAYNNGVGSFDVMMHGSPYDLYVGAASRTATTAAPNFVLFRNSAFWGASTSLTINGATVTGGAATAANTLDRVTIGSYVGSNQGAGLFGAVCLDPSGARCI